MNHFGPKYDEGISHEHAFAETRALCIRDRLLREHGFAILSRPRQGPNLWVKAGRTYEEAAALAIADRRAQEETVLL